MSHSTVVLSLVGAAEKISSKDLCPFLWRTSCEPRLSHLCHTVSPYTRPAQQSLDCMALATVSKPNLLFLVRPVLLLILLI